MLCVSWAANAANKLSLVVSILASAVILALLGPISPAHAGQAGRADIRLPVAGMKHAPVEVVRDRNGNALRTSDGQYMSSNWSGYILPKFQTGDAYTAAQATWAVPGVPATKGLTLSSNWVGIGGFCKNEKCNKVDHKLIQLGSAQGSYRNQTAYFTWYEMLPKASIQTPLAVNPGDVITASLSCNPCTHKQVWTLSMVDDTTGDNWSTTVKYKASQLSAEWIEEAPYSSNGIVALADYGVSTFDQSMVNGAGADLSVGDSIVLLDPHHQTSSVSALDSTDDGFSTCFGTNELAPCFFAPLP